MNTKTSIKKVRTNHRLWFLFFAALLSCHPIDKYPTDRKAFNDLKFEDVLSFRITRNNKHIFENDPKKIKDFISRVQFCTSSVEVRRVPSMKTYRVKIETAEFTYNYYFTIKNNNSIFMRLRNKESGGKLIGNYKCQIIDNFFKGYPTL